MHDKFNEIIHFQYAVEHSTLENYINFYNFLENIKLFWFVFFYLAPMHFIFDRAIEILPTAQHRFSAKTVIPSYIYSMLGFIMLENGAIWLQLP
jgi:hypothetical protein